MQAILYILSFLMLASNELAPRPSANEPCRIIVLDYVGPQEKPIDLVVIGNSPGCVETYEREVLDAGPWLMFRETSVAPAAAFGFLYSAVASARAADGKQVSSPAMLDVTLAQGPMAQRFSLPATAGLRLLDRLTAGCRDRQAKTCRDLLVFRERARRYRATSR